MKETFNKIDSILADILLFVFTFILTLYVWVSLAPRDVTSYANDAIASLGLEQKGFDLSLEKLTLQAGGFDNPLIVRAQNVLLNDNAGSQLAKITTADARPSFRGLFAGELIPRSVTLKQPVLGFSQDSQGAFYIGDIASQNAVSIDSLIQANPNTKPSIIPKFSAIEIEQGDISFSSEKTGESFALNVNSIEVKRPVYSNNIEGKFDVSLRNRAAWESQPTAAIVADIEYDPDETIIELNANVKDILLSDYSSLVSDLASLRTIEVPLTGNVQASINASEESLVNAQIDLSSTGGAFQLQDIMPNRLHLDSGFIKATLPQGLSRVEDLAVAMQMGDQLLRVTGHGASDVGEKWEKPIITANVDLTNFTADFLKNNWPINVGSDAKRWVTQSIRQAEIPTASFAINLDAQSYDTEVLSPRAVLGEIRVANAIVDYVPDFPEARDVSGVVKFEGQALKAYVESAQILTATKLGVPLEVNAKEPNIYIPNLLEDNIKISLNFPINTNIGDVGKFIKPTSYKIPKNFPVQISRLTGNLNSHLKMDIIDRISPIADEVDFKLDAKVGRLAYPALVKGVSLSKLSGDLSAHNKGVSFKGNGLLSGKPFATNINAVKNSQKIEFTGFFPIKLMELADIKPVSQISGDLAFSKAVINLGKTRSSFDIIADSSALVYEIEAANIAKLTGQKGMISAKGSISDTVLNLDSFKIDDTSLKASGGLTYQLKKNQMVRADIKDARLKGQDATANYVFNEAGHQLSLVGKEINITKSPFVKKSEQTQESASKVVSKGIIPDWLKEIPTGSLDIKLDKLILDENQLLTDITATTRAELNKIQMLDAGFKVDQTPLKLTITRKDGKRNLHAQTDNIGGVLKHLGLTKSIRGGSLILNGVFDDSQSNSKLVGRANIADFNLRDVPILAKILSVATLTGVVDSLSGGGLLIQKALIPFHYHDDILSLSDAKGVGPSVGLTANGSLNLAKETLKIEGAVIPAKLLDTLLTNIPLIGQIYETITGGEGLLAVNYSLSEALDNPTVTVNPFSALTPGVLRGFFDILDPKTKAEKKQIKEIDSDIKQQKSVIDAMEKASDETQGVNASGSSTEPKAISKPKLIKNPEAQAVGQEEVSKEFDENALDSKKVEETEDKQVPKDQDGDSDKKAKQNNSDSVAEKKKAAISSLDQKPQLGSVEQKKIPEVSDEARVEKSEKKLTEEQVEEGLKVSTQQPVLKIAEEVPEIKIDKKIELIVEPFE